MANKIQTYFKKLENKNKVTKKTFAVINSYNDDNGNLKVGYITYFMFLSIMPLLITSLTIFDIIFSNNEKLRERMVSSTLSSIPVIGPSLQSDLGFVKGRGLTLLVSLVILLWASRRGALALQSALHDIMVKKNTTQSFISKQLNAYASLGVISVGIIIPTIASTLVQNSFILQFTVFIASIFWNIFIIFLIFMLLTDKKHAIGYGLIFGGIGISIIQTVSVLILKNTLDNTRPLYGTLAVVLALMLWMSLQIKVLLYAAEINATDK